MDDHVYPYWIHHATRPSVLVTCDEELAQLPNGYRYDPFTPEELAEAAAQALQPPPAPPPPPEPQAGDYQDMPGAAQPRRR